MRKSMDTRASHCDMPRHSIPAPQQDRHFNGLINQRGPVPAGAVIHRPPRFGCPCRLGTNELLLGEEATRSIKHDAVLSDVAQ